MAKPLGLLGGSFDPVHNGHLGLASGALRCCVLAEVRLLPLHTPSHRDPPLASPTQRLAMLQLAIEGRQGLLIDERELQRGGVSFTVDTLRSIRHEVAERPLCLIMGEDVFSSLVSWRQWTSLTDFAHIIVAGRPHRDRAGASGELAEFYRAHRTADYRDLHRQPAGRIFDADLEELDVSSTHIRELIAAHQEVAGLLPEKVLSYIKKEGLYHRH